MSLTITLAYEIPQNLQKLSKQKHDLEVVALESPGPNNELSYIGMVESAGRVVSTTAGPPAGLLLTLTYTSLPAFEEQFPTHATQLAAVANLFTLRICSQLATRCKASVPVIT